MKKWKVSFWDASFLTEAETAEDAKKAAAESLTLFSPEYIEHVQKKIDPTAELKVEECPDTVYLVWVDTSGTGTFDYLKEIFPNREAAEKYVSERTLNYRIEERELKE